MGMSNDKAIQIPRFEVYEMLTDEDLSFHGGGLYEILASLFGQFVQQDKDPTTIKDAVLSGLKVTPNSGMAVDLNPGMALSFAGDYTLNESTEAMDFSADSGKPFLCALGNVEGLTVQASHPTINRHDLVQIRPTIVTYDSKLRSFKDPSTGQVSSSPVNTKREIKVQVQIVKGDEDGSDVAPNTTSGWIKIAEIAVGAGVTVINAGDIKNVDALVSGNSNTGWTVEQDRTFSFLGVHADGIKDAHIDWGSGDGQVDLDEVPDGTTYGKVKNTALSNNNPKTDSLVDGTYQKVHGDYVDASGKIEKIKSDCVFENTVTRYYSVSPAGWCGESNKIVMRSERIEFLADTDAWLVVNLPHGAVVTNLYSNAMIIASGDVYVYLLRTPTNDTTVQTLASNHHTATGDLNDTSIDYATIDNVNYKYSIKATNSNHNGATYVRGIVITYTITEPKP